MNQAALITTKFARNDSAAILADKLSHHTDLIEISALSAEEIDGTAGGDGAVIW